MAQSYPVNPDTSFESFIITSEAEQKFVFGKAYGIGDLVPVDYQKLMNGAWFNTYGNATPLREFSHISSQVDVSLLDDENAELYQSSNLKALLARVYQYWFSFVLAAPFKFPLGVVTDMKQNIISKDTLTERYVIVDTIKITWFTIPGSTFAS